MKASILTLVATAAAALGSQAAQAHMLLGNDIAASSKSVSALAVMTAAGTRYHAAADYKTHHRAKPSPPRPTNFFQVARNSF